jgi:hypothetical protein
VYPGPFERLPLPMITTIKSKLRQSWPTVLLNCVIWALDCHARGTHSDTPSISFHVLANIDTRSWQTDDIGSGPCLLARTSSGALCPQGIPQSLACKLITVLQQA